MPYRSHSKLIIFATLAVSLVLAGIWIGRVLTFDTGGVLSAISLGSPIRGYDLNGKLIYSGVLRADDCVRSVNACRSVVDAKGGGLCKVPAGSLKLRYEPLTQAPYSQRTKIDLESR